MTAWTVLATCGPASAISIWWLHRISRRPTPAGPYVPPPITDEYMADEWAVITWNYYREEQQ